MSRERLPFLLVLLTGLASACAFHCAGVIDASDATAAAAIGDGTIDGRALRLGTDLLRLVWAPLDLFRALHLTAGILVALAAALSAAVAFRLADAAPGTGLAAGLFVGGAVLFGADTGSLAVGAAPVVLVLLAGAARAWIAAAPRPLTGGLLLGAAVAAHPDALFLLPAFAWLAMRAPARARSGLGFVLGLALLLLPPPEGSFGDAVTAWWSRGDPGRMAGGFAGLSRAVWQGIGPLGIVAALAGLGAVARQHARFASVPPFVLAFALAAVGLAVGAPADAPTLRALAAWSALLWTPPAFVLLGDRLGAGAADPARSLAAAVRLPGLGLLAAAYLLAANLAALDHSDEPAADWVRDSLRPLPGTALFLTQNPAHVTLAADGVRPDVETVLVSDLAPAEIRRRIETHGGRPALLDASLFFDAARRAEILADGWRAFPLGLTVRVIPPGESLPEQADVDVWDGMDFQQPSPPSPLRDGLTIPRFYARSLLQSGFLYLESSMDRDAEREFVLALSFDSANRTLAATGLGRVFLTRQDPDNTVRALEPNIRMEDPGAWTALELLGTSYMRLERDAEALRTLRRALPLVPAPFTSERAKIQRMIERLERN